MSAVCPRGRSTIGDGGCTCTRTSSAAWGPCWRLGDRGSIRLGARALVVLRLRWFRGASERTVRWVLWLEEWAMIDVLARALVIVHVKLDQLADTRHQAGFFCVLAAALLTELDCGLFRRAVVDRR